MKDLPFSGTAVNVAWANAHKATLEKLLRAQNRSAAWFEDEKNRAEAVQILQSRKRLDKGRRREVIRLLPQRPFFRADRKGFRSKLTALAKAMESLGDLPGALDVDKVILPGVTQITD